jgi:hypothetical protein
MTDWIVKRGTLERRVPDTATLMRLIRERRLKSTDLVFNPARQEWSSAAEVPEISDAFAPETPRGGDSPFTLGLVDTVETVEGLFASAADPTLPNESASEKAATVQRVSRATSVVPSAIYGLLVLVLLSVCALLLAWPLFRPTAQRQAMTQWGYTGVVIPDGKFEDSMNKLGEDGWELIFARRASDGSHYAP